MGIYNEVYEFAARAGAFEGYVYQRSGLDPALLTPWVDHLVRGYDSLPPEVRADFQPLCDGTIGRAIQSMRGFMSEDHELIRKLKGLIAGELPSSPDDFYRSRGKEE
ncbi:MAG TPA: hypothetical protein VGJ94_18295 [Syntrophorhabdaceae bacterium]|jgi:hypothetical protein